MISSVIVGSLLGILSAGVSPAQAAMPEPGVYLNSSGSPLLPLLQGATRSIDIEIYTMNDPTVHALIRSALARHVQVRVLKDPNPFEENCNVFLPVGQTGKPADAAAACVDQRQLVADVQNAGGTFQPFDKSTLCPNGGKASFAGGAAGTGCYEHGKIAIVDGGTALISTGNFDDTNLCIASEKPSRCNRDYTVIENDPTVVSTLENIFDSDLKANSYDVRTLIPSSLDGVLTVSPYSLQPTLDFINSAKTSLSIETQYLKDPEMNAAILNAAKRGVKVDVTVASICAFGTPTASEIKSTTATYGSFDSAGISTAMFNASNTINGHAGYLHAKTIIVDGNRAWVGSENGSTESLTENREYGIIFDTESWIQSVQSVVESDHNSPNSETWSQSLQCAKDGSSSTTKVPDPTTDGDSGTPTKTKKPKKPKNPDPGTVTTPTDPVNPPAPVSPVDPTPTKTKKPKKPKDPSPGTDPGTVTTAPTAPDAPVTTEPTQGKKKKKKKPSDATDPSDTQN